MKSASLSIFAVLAALVPGMAPPAVGVVAKRPNFVWIVSEDNSHFYLRHFFEGGAAAPQIEAMAARGLSFDHAFSNAPVCSVARTSLATACYAPRIGAEFHRRNKLAKLPAGQHLFPWYLRNAGYYTTNKAKEDYNVEKGKGVWDESSGKADWRNRPDKTQPFFHMQTYTQSHESSLHFSKGVYENQKTNADPAKVKLADCYPDTPLFRFTHASYLDRMGTIDEMVGKMVGRLKEEGLLEDTFIFYFGDNGGTLPRGKGYAYDGGLHIPLVVRIPEHFAHLVDAQQGARVKGFVSFVDFGPTVLNLAGVRIPEGIDGRAFLGKGVSMDEVEKRDVAFGYADRMDEKYDMVRSLRKGRYQYIRSYQPWLPDGLQNNYRYKMLAYQEWRELFKAGKLKGAPAQFFQPKPAEALYDIETDPHCVRNLAGDPARAKTLAELRGRLSEMVKSLPDLSFYPESWLVAHALDNPVAFGQAHKKKIAELVDIADLQLLPFDEARPRIVQALESGDWARRYWGAMACTTFGQAHKKKIAEMVDIADLQLQPFDEARPKLVEALGSGDWARRYWGAMACTAFGGQASGLADKVKPLLKDKMEIVRVRAAEFLGRIGEIDPQRVLLELVNTTTDPVLASEALNSVVWFRDFFGARHPVDPSDLHPVCGGRDVQRRLEYLGAKPGAQRKAKNAKRRMKARN